jgi:hypothetical protein
MAAKLGDDNVPNSMGGGTRFPDRHGRGLTLHARNSFSSPASNAGLIFYDMALHYCSPAVIFVFRHNSKHYIESTKGI